MHGASLLSATRSVRWINENRLDMRPYSNCNMYILFAFLFTLSASLSPRLPEPQKPPHNTTTPNFNIGVPLIKRSCGLSANGNPDSRGNRLHQLWLEAPATPEELEATVRFANAYRALSVHDIREFHKWRPLRFIVYRMANVQMQHPEAFIDQVRHSEALRHDITQHLRRHADRSRALAANDTPQRGGAGPRDYEAIRRLGPIMVQAHEVMRLWPSFGGNAENGRQMTMRDS